RSAAGGAALRSGTRTDPRSRRCRRAPAGIASPHADLLDSATPGNLSMSTPARPRILTGDTPTGRLHLGHWVGSLENRVRLQDQYDCYFIIANIQAFSTRMDCPTEIHDNVIEIMLDYLAIGIDPKRSTVFI